MKIHKKNSGFTIIELLVAISIIGLLAASSYVVFLKFNQQQSINIAFEDLVNVLNQAKSSAASHVVESCTDSLAGYRVSFTNIGYSLEEICETSAGAQSVTFSKTTSLPPGIGFETLPSPILFKTLSKGVSSPAIILLISTSDPSRYRTISINSEGVIEEVGK